VAGGSIASLDSRGLEPDEAAFIAGLAPPTPTAYHRLNPLTKLVLAGVAVLGTLIAGGYVGPVALLLVLVLPGALTGRVVRRTIATSLVVGLPIGISATLVAVLTRAGATVMVTIGPFAVTAEGVDFAGQVLVRLAVIAAALTLFGLTTDPRALVADLERRGLPPRLVFAVAATVRAVPAMAERAAVIQSAQRARGLDTEGSLRARARGVLPLIVPAVLSSLTEVEVRSLALEARAFGRPGRRELLWTPADSDRERWLRWLLGALLAALLITRLGGLLPAGT
jgi:energy-coupling factor transport system permease protein